MIIFRADGNSIIGMGHVMRSMTIAKAVQSRGESVLFVTADSMVDTKLDEAGLNHVSLASDYKDMESEIDALREIIEEYKASIIVVDSYQVTNKYLSEITKLVPSIYLDDLCNETYPVSALINYNISADLEEYRRLYQRNKVDDSTIPEFILGLNYVPLRDMFRLDSDKSKLMASADKVPNGETKIEVLLTAGGADPLNIAELVARKWIEVYKDKKLFELNIVCGPLYNQVEKLKEVVKECDNITLHIDVKNMAELMNRCQIAMAATGSTIYELCALGIPTVSFYYVENQRRIAEAFEKQTPVKNCGDMSKDSDVVLERLFTEVKELCDDGSRRRAVAKEMKKKVDGMGAYRIADKLIEIAEMDK